MKNKKKPSPSDTFRIHFPEDELKHLWLPMLLDAFAIIDSGMSEALQREKRLRGRKPACHEGCSGCCRFQPDIAVYPIELAGISWYATEKVQGPLREALRKKLSAHDRKPPCPFLVEDRCAVYHVRPMACRQFTVFTRPCEEGEDPFFTRKKDVLIPLQEYIDRAIFTVLPFFGIQDASERKKAVKEHLLHGHLQNLQSCSWRTLTVKMAQLDLSHLHSS